MPGLQPLDRTDFSGGVNAIASPHHIRRHEVLRADNFILDEDGALTVRDGATTIDQAPAGVVRILTLGNFTRTDGAVVNLAVVRLADGRQQLMRRDTTPWAVLGTFSTQYEIPTIVPWLNMAIIMAGYEVPKVTDGTTFTPFTGLSIIPGAQHLVVHLNSLWAWNTSNVTSTYDGPSSLRQSDVENYNSWPTSNQLFLAKDDGQAGTGLAVFTVADTGIAPTDFLVAFKHFSGYTVQGPLSLTVPQFQRIKSDMGCVAPRSIVFISSRGLVGLLRLTHRGFALFSGLNDELISDPVRPYILGHDDITGLTWNAIFYATAAQVQNPPLYLCACPVAPSGQLTRVFVFDLIRKAWTICTFPVSFSTINPQLAINALPVILAGESGGQRVQQLFAGATDDDGVPIDWLVRVPPVGPVLRRVYIRRTLLKLFHIAARQAITGTFVMGPQQSAQYLRKTIKVSVGADAPPGSTFFATAEDDASFDIGLTGEVLYSEFSGSGMLGIRGQSWQTRAKPLTRPARV